MKKKEWKPRLIRRDIISNLPVGGQLILSEKLGMPKSQINLALNGRRISKEKKDIIIKEAELMAAINIWKTRFCKYPSKI